MMQGNSDASGDPSFCCRCGKAVMPWQGKGRIDGELAHSECALEELDEEGMDDFHNDG